jgi:hypothetical protein
MLEEGGAAVGSDPPTIPRSSDASRQDPQLDASGRIDVRLTATVPARATGAIIRPSALLAGLLLAAACVGQGVPGSPVPGALVTVEFAAPTGIRGPAGDYHMVGSIDGRVLRASAAELTVRITTARSIAGGLDPSLDGRTVSVHRDIQPTITVLEGPEAVTPVWLVTVAPMLVFLVGLLGPT